MANNKTATTTGRFRAYLQMFVAMVLYGSGTPISKIVSDAFPFFIASSIRMLFVVLILLPLAWSHRKDIHSIGKRDWINITLIGVIGMFGFSLFLLFGIKMTTGVLGSVVTSTVPAVTAVGAYLFLKEHLGWKKSLAVGLAVAGVLVVSLSGETESASNMGMGMALIGMLLVFAAVCSDATHTLLAKVTTRNVNPFLILVLAASLACILSAGPAIYEAQPSTFKSPMITDWLALLWWGVATTALGSILWYRGISKVPASVAAGFIGISPISGVLLSYLLLEEEFHWLHLAGFLLVFSGVLLIAYEHWDDFRKSDGNDQEKNNAIKK